MEPPAVTSCSPHSQISAGNNIGNNNNNVSLGLERLLLLGSGGLGGGTGVGGGSSGSGRSGGGSSSSSSSLTSSTPYHHHLQIDAPTISFNSSVNRPFEDLPENFLETISPQQTQPPGPGGANVPSNGSGAGGQQDSPQLASLAPMSLGSGDSAYATLAPMNAQPSYTTTSMKMESIQSDCGAHSRGIHNTHPSALDKLSFSSGPAGLLSPLHTNRRQETGSGLLDVHHQNGARGGTPSDLLANLRRPLHYIKEEVDLSQEFKSVDSQLFGHHQSQQSTSLLTQEQRQQQELDHRLANAETPPAVSNVELASSFIATMIGEQPPESPSPEQSLYEHQTGMYRHQQQQHQLESAELSGSDDLEVGTGAGPSDEHAQMSALDEVPLQSPSSANMDSAQTTTTSAAIGRSGTTRTCYSTKDTSDPLNAEIDDDIYIDTKDLCRRIAWELKQHSIPQAIFAERILCRSQGTLSDLLRNPKPWNKLKSGRETFRRMFNWVQQPLELRLGILDMYKGDENFGGVSASSNGMGKLGGVGVIAARVMSPPTPAQNARQGSRHKNGVDGGENGHGHNGSATKRPRLVFTDIQKRTLQAIFKETQRPSREMQQTIAEHLRLDLSTVANFFMNARRRSRSGPLIGDEPEPYQQVRPITPPPDSPPHQHTAHQRSSTQSRCRPARSSLANATPQHHTNNNNTSNTTSSSSSSSLRTACHPNMISSNNSNANNNLNDINNQLRSQQSSHIENTVAHVAEQAAEYARRLELKYMEPMENGAGECSTPGTELRCEVRGEGEEPDCKSLRLDGCVESAVGMLDSRHNHPHHNLRGADDGDGGTALHSDLDDDGDEGDGDEQQQPDDGTAMHTIALQMAGVSPESGTPGDDGVSTRTADDVGATIQTATGLRSGQAVSRRGDNLYVVSLGEPSNTQQHGYTAAVSMQTSSSAHAHAHAHIVHAKQQQRTLPVMSFGNKLVTVKVERESANNPMIGTANATATAQNPSNSGAATPNAATVPQ